MRIYHGCPSPNSIRKARLAAPSHTHGACWTPAKMTPKEWPYFIDNGAFTDSFDVDEWVTLLDDTLAKMPYLPDFVVLPDCFNDASETMDKHREYLSEVQQRNLQPPPVLQPGMSVKSQVSVYSKMGTDVVFVGGESRWQRSHGREILSTGHEYGLRVHIGNPGGKDKLLWWAKAGADSVDTSSILQNQYWHWLEALEGLNDTPLKNTHTQQTSLIAHD